MSDSRLHATHDHGTVRTETLRGPREHEPPGYPTGLAARAIQDMVAEFYVLCGRTINVPVAEAPDDLIELRIDLIQEELDEVVRALRSGDVLAIAQELADLAYVTAGVAVDLALTIPAAKPLLGSLVADCGRLVVALSLRSRDLAGDLARLMATLYRYGAVYGVDLDAAVAEVHRANLRKVGPDGRVHIRPDGKILKPPGWQRPDMRCAVLDFTVPTNGHQAPPWWLDGIRGA